MQTKNRKHPILTNKKQKKLYYIGLLVRIYSYETLYLSVIISPTPMQLWQRFKQLFQPNNNGQCDQHDEEIPEEEREILLQQDLLVRSPQAMQAAQDWAQAPSTQPFWQEIRQLFDIYLSQHRNADCSINFLCIPSVKGLALHFDPQRWQADDFLYLFDYLKIVAQSFGYWQHLADERTYQRGQQIHRTLRYYLKPPRHFDAAPHPQAFGNIMVCLCYVEDQPVSLRLSATYYNDRNFAPPLPFSDFIAALAHP